jgi:hypothetical protein
VAAEAPPGPLLRAALASAEAQQTKSPARRSGKSSDDWSRVGALRQNVRKALTGTAADR